MMAHDRVAMPLENWIQHSRLDQFLYDWQTVIAGVLALAAGVLTVVATMIIAHRQIKAAREVITATRDQTATTIRLERTRVAGEIRAFHAMLAVAMTRVVDEVAWARQMHPDVLTLMAGSTVEALTIRQCITKGGFTELRAVCVKQGDPRTGEFLDLEREIDNFALQYEYNPSKTVEFIRLGKHAGLGDQLTLIETKAIALREKAVNAAAITEAVLEGLTVNAAAVTSSP